MPFNSDNEVAAGDIRPLHLEYSFFEKGRPLWFTSLPTSDSPGVLSFGVAMARAIALSWLVVLGMYPFFSWWREGSLEFGFAEGFFFAFVFAFFEDHARWNYVLNAQQPFKAAIKFAALISAAELLMACLTSSENYSLLQIVFLRAPTSVLHFVLACIAVRFIIAGRYVRFAAFIICVIAHSTYNVFGIGSRFFNIL